MESIVECTDRALARGVAAQLMYNTEHEYIAIVCDFVRQWDDQKLAEVLAFAEDGKMDFADTCCCLIGVASSANLHENHTHHESYCDSYGHYTRYKERHRRAFIVEDAYYRLGKPLSMITAVGSQKKRDAILIGILREVIAERDVVRKTHRESHCEEHLISV